MAERFIFGTCAGHLLSSAGWAEAAPNAEWLLSSPKGTENVWLCVQKFLQLSGKWSCPWLKLSCEHSSPPLPPPAGASSSVDMESGGGELSDSGSSGYWSWDHGNVSPAPSPSVTEMDSSPDEGLHMESEQGEELSAKKPKVHSVCAYAPCKYSANRRSLLSLKSVVSLFLQSSFRSVYKCLWPSCGKVLTSSVGIKRHIRVMHLGWADILSALLHLQAVSVILLRDTTGATMLKHYFPIQLGL